MSQPRVQNNQVTLMTLPDSQKSADDPLLSVVMVTFHSRDDVGRCLDHLLAELSSIGRSELIVVDNASQDGTVELVREKVPTAKTVVLDSNTGFAAAANRGASLASGNYLLFLNPDVMLPDGAVLKLLERAERVSGDHIIGPELQFPNGTAQASFFRKPTLFRLALELFLPYRVALPLLTERPSQTRKVGAVSGACMLVRRKAFEALGGFDERFFLYSEDFDLCFRAHRSGIDVIALPEVTVVHALGSSAWKDLESFFYHYYRAKILFARMHFGPFTAQVAAMLVVKGVVLRFLGYAVVGTLSGGRSYRARARALLTALRRILQSLGLHSQT
jgi:GT2 family glycosyltransferase